MGPLLFLINGGEEQNVTQEYKIIDGDDTILNGTGTTNFNEYLFLNVTSTLELSVEPSSSPISSVQQSNEPSSSPSFIPSISTFPSIQQSNKPSSSPSFSFEPSVASLQDEWFIDYRNATIEKGALRLSYNIGADKTSEQVQVRIYDVNNTSCIANNNFDQNSGLKLDTTVAQESLYSIGTTTIDFKYTLLKNSTYYYEQWNNNTFDLFFCVRVDLHTNENKNLSVSFLEIISHITVNLEAGAFSLSTSINKDEAEIVEKDISGSVSAWICDINNGPITEAFKQNSIIRICVQAFEGFSIKTFLNVVFKQNDIIQLKPVFDGVNTELTETTIGNVSTMTTRLTSELFSGSNPQQLEIVGKVDLSMTGSSDLQGGRKLYANDDGQFSIHVELKPNGINGVVYLVLSAISFFVLILKRGRRNAGYVLVPQ